jgi:hypothetical protein
MGNWAEQVIIAMDDELAVTGKRELRFFRMAELKRNIARIDLFSGQCTRCEDFKPEVEAVSGHIEEAVNVPGPERRELDRLIFRLSNHIMKEHGFFPLSHYKYLYSVIGIIFGSLSGFLLMKLFPATKWYLMVFGIIAGLIAGMVFGIIKDQRIMKEGKLM